MSVALHGNLRDFGIAEVFQLIGQQRKTGTLTVEGDEGSIFIAFDDGRVVRGGPSSDRSEREPLGEQLVRAGYLTREQLDDLQRESARSARPLRDLFLAAGLIDEATAEEVQHLLTKETVFDVMRRSNGDFAFQAEAVHHDTPPEKLLAAEQILMDGLRMLDEWQTFQSLVPDAEIVFRRVGNLEMARAITRSDEDGCIGSTERVLQLVDGRLPVRRIVDLSRIGTFEATRALAELRQAGVIDVAAAGGSSRRKKKGGASSSRPRVPIGSILRAALSTAIPLLALGAVGWQVLERVGDVGGLPGAAIPMRSIGDLEARYESELIRNRLEAYYFAEGRYPESLASLAGGLPALTRERLGDYYYIVRGDDVVLLAPID